MSLKFSFAECLDYLKDSKLHLSYCRKKKKKKINYIKDLSVHFWYNNDIIFNSCILEQTDEYRKYFLSSTSYNNYVFNYGCRT